MHVKIYSINDCRYCETLKYVLHENNIPYTEIKVSRLGEVNDCMPFSEYIKLEPTIPLVRKLSFPQVYFDEKYIGSMKDALNYLHGNETK